MTQERWIEIEQRMVDRAGELFPGKNFISTNLPMPTVVMAQEEPGKEIKITCPLTQDQWEDENTPVESLKLVLVESIWKEI